MASSTISVQELTMAMQPMLGPTAVIRAPPVQDLSNLLTVSGKLSWLPNQGRSTRVSTPESEGTL
eukprot:6068051-Amphidinium_carterae.1